MFVVAVVRGMAVRISPAGDIALIVTLVLPNRFATPDYPYEAVVMLVGSRLIIPGNTATRRPASSY